MQPAIPVKNIQEIEGGPGSVKGDLHAYNPTTAILSRIGAGPDGSVLIADSSQPLGLRYSSRVSQKQVNIADYATGGNGTAETPYTGWLATLPTGDGINYYASGHFSAGATWTITGNHCSVIGEDRNTTIFHAAAGATVIEYTTGNANYSRFSDFTVLGNSTGTGHGLYLHDFAAAIEEAVIERVNAWQNGGCGIRLGRPREADINHGTNIFYCCAFRDLSCENNLQDQFAAQNLGPSTVLENIVYVNPLNGYWGMYFGSMSGKITCCSGNNNSQPTIGAQNVDGGGSLIITGESGASHVLITASNFEAAGGRFVSLPGGVTCDIAITDCHFQDTNTKYATTPDRTALWSANVNCRLTLLRNRFLTSTAWANGNPIHIEGSMHPFMAGNVLVAGGTTQLLTTVWSEVSSIALDAHQIDFTYGQDQATHNYGYWPSGEMIVTRLPTGANLPYGVRVMDWPDPISQNPTGFVSCNVGDIFFDRSAVEDYVGVQVTAAGVVTKFGPKAGATQTGTFNQTVGVWQTDSQGQNRNYYFSGGGTVHDAAAGSFHEWRVGGGSLKAQLDNNGNHTITGGLYTFRTTLAAAPAGYEGGRGFITNGRKVGEGAGAGTGVPVYYSNGSWRSFVTDAAVTT